MIYLINDKQKKCLITTLFLKNYFHICGGLKMKFTNLNINWWWLNERS
ncbi:hypothetical protein ACVW2L_001997 [Mucilaginibacter sp. HD30]